MKQLFLIIILNLTVFTSFAQERDCFEFNIKSKLDTEVGISVAVYYDSEHRFTQSDSIIQRIDSIIKDSLQQFDIFEMYFDERSTMNVIIDSIFNIEFRTLNIEPVNVTLLEVNIPKEAELLNKRFLELEQRYLEVLLEIYKRKKELKNKLETDNNLSDLEKSEIEKQILVLENYKYISRLYDKKIKDLIRNDKD